MSKRLIMVLALATVFCITGAAYAEVQNIKVSGDVMVSGIARNYLTLNDPSDVGASNDGYGENIVGMLSQTRLRVDADLTDNVVATIRLLNERMWGEEPDDSTTTARTHNTDIQVDLAYVSLKEFLNSPITLVAGRQELSYGNGLIIGDPDTNGIAAGHNTNSRYLPNSIDDLSVRKSFDAIKAILNYDPLVIDLVYAKIDENSIETEDDIDLAGVNAAFMIDDNLLAEAYLWQRSRDSIVGSQTENLRTTGSRVMFTGFENIVLGLEGAFQFGDHIANTALYPNEQSSTNKNRKVSAYALQAMAQLGLPDIEFTPILSASYTYLSGDPYHSDSDNYKGWDPMFEDQAGGTLFNKIMGYSNAQLLNGNISLVPMEDVRLTLKYWYLMLNRAFPDSANAVVLTGVASDPTYEMREGRKSLGQEFDLILTYDYTEDVQFVLNTGIFLPGSAFDSRNNKDASQVIGSMKVSF